MMKKKVYALDTSVLLHDPESLFSFNPEQKKRGEENDVVIPMTVLEELDQKKVGSETINRIAREVIRKLEHITEGRDPVEEWVYIRPETKKGGRMKFFVADGRQNSIAENEIQDANKIFGKPKPDHDILNAVYDFKMKNPDLQVIFVSKDINLRLKSRGMGIPAEDYKKDKVEQSVLDYTGISIFEGIDSDAIDKLYSNKSILVEKILPADVELIPNQYCILKNGSKSALVYYNAGTGELEKLEKKDFMGIKPRNAEQIFAMHALNNPNIKVVNMRGIAGSGKTLLAIASAMEQKLHYKKILITRPAIALEGKDLGFLPGDLDSKMAPFLEPIQDNLEFISNQPEDKKEEQTKKASTIKGMRGESKNGNKSTEPKIKMIVINYIKGRTFNESFIIVDEAQNLTMVEMKAIMTRIGFNTKIIFCGDNSQIDTPYMDASSNGLALLTERFKGLHFYSEIQLVKGERSDVAEAAANLL